ncbi:MAG: hypothetical protein ACFB0G_08255 [Leptolyngbyaceae cyanobacterium]
MWKRIAWQRLSLGALSLGTLGLLGCPAGSQLSLSQSPDPTMMPVVQSEGTETAIAEQPPQPVEFAVCGEIPDWERLSLAEQTAALTQQPRYGEAITSEPLKSLFDKFWQQSVISFTTYGLSARTEPIYLSGVWTGIDAMENCYEGDRPEAINQGELAELWLIGHQVVDITWADEAYQVTVDTTTTGLQFVQFDRLETGETLPLVVIESDGGQVAVASGDW